MLLDDNSNPARRVAVVGGGISGMAAAHLLAGTHHVVLFEAKARLGGHARTVLAGKRGDQPVDTGFIVYNRVNYPHLVALFEKLDVPVAESSMSFGVSVRGGWLEYALASVDALFAQRRNIFNPAFLRMCRDVLYFNKHAQAAANDTSLTIGGLLDKLGTGPWFRDYYILPFSAAIWSTPSAGILDFPAQSLIRFFKNHALMSLSGQHQWFTVRGGSIEYVRRLQAELARQAVDLRLATSVAGIKREGGFVYVRVVGGEWQQFDDLVMATHSDEALALLSDASAHEHSALGAVRYQSNSAVLHADASVMPKSRKCWASWVYTEPAHARGDKIDLTYWMNSLQPIPKDEPLFVTLNSNSLIRDGLIYDQTEFRHPVYDLAAVAAQGQVRAMNGARNTWFCGAWMKNGFHEDGFGSAVDVADAMQVRLGVARAA